jgi:hypothetical protein
MISVGVKKKLGRSYFPFQVYVVSKKIILVFSLLLITKDNIATWMNALFQKIENKHQL